MSDVRAGRKAMLTRQFPTDFRQGKWAHETRVEEVRVMAIAEGHAMVRFPNAAPFVVALKDLVAIPISAGTSRKTRSPAPAETPER